MNSIGVYIHIPFCERKCLYCDFNSGPSSEEMKAEYIHALIKEIGLYKEVLRHRKIKTLFIGGGTPSSVPPSLFEQLLRALHDHINFSFVEEFSIEANPGTVTEEKLLLYKKYGINRISFGVQSFKDNLLKGIGRLHNAKEACDSIALAKKCGFSNINVDLMHNLPEMTEDDLSYSIERAMALDVSHISLYSLILEEGTPLYHTYEKKGLALLDEETERRLFHKALDLFDANDFKRYEISNFAKAGLECKHNMLYWTLDDYIGLGLSAHGKYIHTRYHNEGIMTEYIASLNNEQFPIVEKEVLSIEEEAFEAIMLGLRLMEGINLEAYYRRYNIILEERYSDVIKDQMTKGTLVINKGYIYLTDYGHDISNSVIVEFME